MSSLPAGSAPHADQRGILPKDYLNPFASDTCKATSVLCVYLAAVVFQEGSDDKRINKGDARLTMLVRELAVALSQVTTLSGLLPICASCKKIRNDQGNWEQMETYIRDRSQAEFTHGYCPDCAAKMLSQIRQKR